MANEIQVSGQIVIYDNYNYRVQLAPGTINASFASTASTAAASGTYIIGTTAETIPVGDVTTAGWAYFRNVSTSTDTSYYVDVGLNTSTFAPFLRLYPGQYAIGPVAETTILGRANTSGTNSIGLQVHIQSR